MTQAQLKITGPALRGFAGMYIAQYFGPGLSEKEFRSDIKSDEPTFQRLTGFTQQTLVAKWNSGNPKDKGYTTCGDVVGHFTKKHLGMEWIGLINPEPTGCQAWCDAQGKGIAWIPSSRGLKPTTRSIQFPFGLSVSGKLSTGRTKLTTIISDRIVGRSIPRIRCKLSISRTR